MTQVNIQNSTAQKLISLAEKTNQSIDDLLELLIQKYSQDFTDTSTDVDDEIDVPGSSIRLAQASLEWGFASDSPDIVEKSREILNTEFADYLFNKMNKNNE